MASIAEWIQKIKTAIYGEEVRGAIWQSLEAMNTEVEAINVDEDQIERNKQDIATNTAAITALNNRLNGYVTIENFTITIGQCKPGVDYRQSVSVSKEGYRPFGIIGYDVLGTYGSWFHVTKLGIVDWNTATVVLRAPVGEFTTDNTAVKITVLYQKNITS